MLNPRRSFPGPPAESESSDADEVRTTSVFGLDVATVALPSDLLTEDRMARVNGFWDLLGEREALVTPGIATSGESLPLYP